MYNLLPMHGNIIDSQGYTLATKATQCNNAHTNKTLRVKNAYIFHHAVSSMNNMS